MDKPNAEDWPMIILAWNETPPQNIPKLYFYDILIDPMRSGNFFVNRGPIFILFFSEQDKEPFKKVKASILDLLKHNSILRVITEENLIELLPNYPFEIIPCERGEYT